MQVHIKKYGNSRGIIIPAAVLEQLGWKEGMTIDLSISNGALIAYPLASSLAAILETVPKDYCEPEEGWGADTGKEVKE